MLFRFASCVSFDFFMFNFHVPMFALAAKQAVPVARQSAIVTNRVFDFMAQMKTGFARSVNAFFRPRRSSALAEATTKQNRESNYHRQ